jgi:hypothetical protein
MSRPRINDDGQTVELDLHGVHVDESVAMIRRVARLASGRGRGTLRIIHGSSTSDPLARNRTVRHALQELLDSGDLRPWVIDAVRYEGHTVIALNAGAINPTRLSRSDLLAAPHRH